VLKKERESRGKCERARYRHLEKTADRRCLQMLNASLKQGYVLPGAVSICVLGLDVKEFGRSEAIDGRKSSIALRQKRIKLKPRRSFGFILDEWLPY